MNNRISSEEVANQFAKAIQLLLEWAQQEMMNPPQMGTEKTLLGKNRSETPTISETGRLLRAKEVAEALQVSRALAYQMMRRNEIPTVRIGTAVRVRRSDLEEFIKRSGSS